jgi:hypothetical protein
VKVGWYWVLPMVMVALVSAGGGNKEFFKEC